MRFVGDFWTTIESEHCVGELVLANEETRLAIFGRDASHFKDAQVIHGQTYDFTKITCLGCLAEFWSGPIFHNDSIRQIELFPHHVLTGRIYFDHEIDRISEVIFEFTDGKDFFKDRRRFGTLEGITGVLQTALDESIGRGREFQADGVISYFTGKRVILSVDTTVGKITVHNKFIDCASDGIEHKIEISLKFDIPVQFDEAIRRLLTIRSFFTVFSGRPQGVSDVRVIVPSRGGLHSGATLQLNSSYAPLAAKHLNARPPGRFELPMHVAHEPDAFGYIMSSWLSRHETWDTARSYFVQCLEEENFYDAGRLIRVANLFDLIPDDDVNELPELPASTASAIDEMSRIVQRLPRGLERGVLLGAIRIALNRKHKEKLTLRQRVQARAQIVEAHVGDHLPDLDIVIDAAIEVRNYFVHGNRKIDFEKISGFLDLMTDALEFIFAFSDLVDAGWAGQRWMTSGGVAHHKFGKYLWRHRKEIVDFKLAWESAAVQRQLPP